MDLLEKSDCVAGSPHAVAVVECRLAESKAACPRKWRQSLVLLKSVQIPDADAVRFG